MDEEEEVGNEGINVEGDDDDDEEGDFYLNTHMHVKSKSGKVHSTTSFTQSPKFFLSKHSNKVMSLASFQYLDQTVLVSASLDGTIRAWTLNQAYRPKDHSKQQSPMECSVTIIGELSYPTLPCSTLLFYGLQPSLNSTPTLLCSTLPFSSTMLLLFLPLLSSLLPLLFSSLLPSLISQVASTSRMASRVYPCMSWRSPLVEVEEVLVVLADLSSLRQDVTIASDCGTTPTKSRNTTASSTTTTQAIHYLPLIFFMMIGSLT